MQLQYLLSYQGTLKIHLSVYIKQCIMIICLHFVFLSTQSLHQSKMGWQKLSVDDYRQHQSSVAMGKSLVILRYNTSQPWGPFVAALLIAQNGVRLCGIQSVILQKRRTSLVLTHPLHSHGLLDTRQLNNSLGSCSFGKEFALCKTCLIEQLGESHVRRCQGFW